MRLSISNSSNYLIIGAILLIVSVVIVLTEFFYREYNVPTFVGEDHDLILSNAKKSQQPLLFVIGDSRAEGGIIPELFDATTKYDSYNIGRAGIYKGYYYKLRRNNITPDKIIVAVSPYSVFNSFQYKEQNLFKRMVIFRKPNIYTERYLSSKVNRNTHLHYGFAGITDVIRYGKISENYSPKGWHSYTRLGSDAYYTYKINLESYKHKIIEEYKVPSKINKGKNNFENMVNEMRKDNISVLFVRIPTSSEIKSIEDEKYPWFSNYIEKISSQYNFEYVEFKDFEYPKDEVDGSHLNRNSAYKFTKELLEYIR